MRRLIPLIVVLGLAGLPALASSYYLSPDVPTDDPVAFVPIYLPWDIVRNDSAVYGLTLSLPASTPIDALHHMNNGHWLFSVEVPTELPPGIGPFYDPRDVVEFDPPNSAYSLLFCGGPLGVPAGSGVDAAFLDGGDKGNLVVSFDVPTDLSALGGGVYDPADLVRFNRSGAGCLGWTLVPAPFFDASAALPPIPTTSDVTGADQRPGLTILTFDVPTTLGATTYLPGELVSWNLAAAAFASFQVDPAWPITSRADAYAFLANPCLVPPTIGVDKSTVTVGDLTFTWSASPSVGAEDYGIYEGTITQPWVYNHVRRTCTDTGGNFTEDITPGAGDRYYLVVPNNPNDEGSYGTRSTGAQRPMGSPACRTTQELEICP